ncbi:DUF6417 family protein [Streptomyces huiliensis]|uniref:DUF6417 family protein n=1 Tax=Streptomyces huiliensis TaxID=2876027 RepID=UPI001CBEFD4A|nr:DUF6417 family protein [Streptomyces huiliensis]MBZ4321208.1 DUF6417 family protein [Streptomyces huiliensis]
MGGLKDAEYEALLTLRDLEGQQRHGWATDGCGVAPQAVERLRAAGLCETAGRSALAALPGPPRWAARLTPEGHDALVYLPARRWGDGGAAPDPGLPAGTREVRLRPQAMEVLRLYLGLGPRLRRPPAPGLEEAVRTARRADKGSAWTLHVTDAQLASIAYAMWLEARAHTVAPANRLAREHDACHKPSNGATN